MNRYLLHGKLTASAENAEKLVSILLKASELVSAAKGCVLYLISKDPADNNGIWVTEIWESRDDHARSLNVPGVQELIGQALPLLAGPPQKGQELQLIGGTGL